MKKVLVSLIVASAMVLGGTGVASAATKAPSITKPTAAAEGSAKHETAETSKTQKVESKAMATHKKTTKKKSALVTKKK